MVNFSANNKATKPTMAPLPLVNSASGLNGPKALPGAVTPSGLDFFNTGANEAAKMKMPQNGAKNKPAPGYVTVSETPSANVNVLVENTCPHKDLFWVISVYKAAIQPICATLPLIISIAVAFENTFMASSRSCVSSPSGAASATEPSAGSLFLIKKERESLRSVLFDLLLVLENKNIRVYPYRSIESGVSKQTDERKMPPRHLLTSPKN